MSGEWDRGVLDKSSWHRLETIGAMATAEDMIAHGERAGAWPTAVRYEALTTTSGLKVDSRAVVGDYAAHDSRAIGVVGDRFHATTPEQWRDLVRAATTAGARPNGAFALRGGSRVLATFDVGNGNGLRNHLLLADAFDGSLRLTCGTSTIRVVCANTLAMAMRSDGKGMAQLRHTASLPEKIEALGAAIGNALAHGRIVREAFDAASETQLRREDAEAVLVALFPDAADEASAASKTRATEAREAAIFAARLPHNNVGPTLGTLWNAATWLVDRTPKGGARECRGGADRLDSLLFGSRARRIAEIQHVIEVVLRDGSVAALTVPQATEMGVDPQQIGAQLLADMLDDDSN